MTEFKTNEVQALLAYLAVVLSRRAGDHGLG
jgi:hypothetical protein